jgi:hypothetical protein
MAEPSAVAGIEASLEGLLDGRTAHLVLRRDGPDLADVWRSGHKARPPPAYTPGMAAAARTGHGAALVPPPDGD